MAVITALVAVPQPVAAGAPTCFGEVITIQAVAGVTTVGTPGRDVIMGTAGPDIIDSGGGSDRVCSRGGNDVVRSGPGADLVDLGAGDDLAYAGAGDDLVRGRIGRDTIHGSKGRDNLVGGGGRDRLFGRAGRDTLDGGKGVDTCNGGPQRDRAKRCENTASVTESIADSFAGSGPLIGYTTNNRAALPSVARVQGRYRAELTSNVGNVTLHFHGDQGRLDARMVEFPFDVVVRNIGVGRQSNSQIAPAPNGNPYVFAGVQVHVPNLDDTNSSHVVVGHRGGTHFTVEGKNTRDGSSSVNDVGANRVPDGRADIRIVGNDDRTLTVYWQRPNLSPGVADDTWILYNGSGQLPGQAPDYPSAVYVGLITYAFGSTGVPFVGTADAIGPTTG
ncbi:MAG: calcium-binding protein [Acidimicrobiales bacterium]